MDPRQCTEAILAAKAERALSFAALAERVGRSEVWTAAAIFGQAQMDAPEAEALAEVLGLGPDAVAALQQHPLRGSLDGPVPVDPLLYRFHEITQVYGTTIKALINEKFGEGIMSAIDFEMEIDRIEDPKGDRVKVTYNGKFLPYASGDPLGGPGKVLMALRQSLGSTGSLSRASTPKAHSWTRWSGSPATNRSSPSMPRANSLSASERLWPRWRDRSRARLASAVYSGP